MSEHPTAISQLQSEILESEYQFVIDLRLLQMTEYDLLQALILQSMILAIDSDDESDEMAIFIEQNDVGVELKKLITNVKRLEKRGYLTYHKTEDKNGCLVSFRPNDFLEFLENHIKSAIMA